MGGDEKFFTLRLFPWGVGNPLLGKQKGSTHKRLVTYPYRLGLTSRWLRSVCDCEEIDYISLFSLRGKWTRVHDFGMI